MERTITVSGIDIKFKSSGALPRLYRILMKRDLFMDMSSLEGLDPNNLSPEIFTALENIAYVMARHANADEKRTIDEWLEQFDMFGLTEALPQIVELWTDEIATMSDSKKKSEQ